MAYDINALIQNAQTQAQSLSSSAQAELANSAVPLYEAVRSLSAIVVDPIPHGSLPNFVPAVPPTLLPVVVNGIARPDAPLPALGADSPLSIAGTAPTFAVAVPTLTVPTMPAQLAPFALGVPTVNMPADLPDAPDLIPIDAPQLHDVNIGPAPYVPQVIFEGQRPDDVADPGDFTGELDAAYSRASPQMVAAINGQLDAWMARINPQFDTQMAAIETQLSKYLAGGTALQPEVEDALYERAKGKTDADWRRARDVAFGDAAARGFTLPTGAIFSAINQARLGAADSLAKAATDIAIAQAEMEQKNLQFAVTTSSALRATALNAGLQFHQNLIAINAQALDYAKAVLQAHVAIYNAIVEAYKAKLELYRADAQVFSARIDAAGKVIENYKAEIQAELAKVQVDASRVDIFRARIAAQSALVDQYKARIQAIAEIAGLERLKIDVFQAQVQGYSALVGAKNAEWQGYNAAWSGEESKVRVYSAQVNAYQATVDGWRAKVQAGAAQVEAIMSQNRANSAVYAATMDGYRAAMGAEGVRVNAEIQAQDTLIRAYSTANQAAVAANAAAVEQYRVVSTMLTEQARLKATTQLENARLKITGGEGIARLASANANTFGTMASAALSGINSLVQTEAA